jgi:hypothetical protein
MLSALLDTAREQSRSRSGSIDDDIWKSIRDLSAL